MRVPQLPLQAHGGDSGSCEASIPDDSVDVDIDGRILKVKAYDAPSCGFCSVLRILGQHRPSPGSQI
jgi:hypothetical protein